MPPQQYQSPSVTPPSLAGHNPYDFIMNPGQPPKRTPLAGGSLLTRLAVMGVLLVVLLFAFMIFKNLVSGTSGNIAAMITVAQRQQEIVRLTTAAANEPDINATNKGIALTTKVSLTSAQSDLLEYIGAQGREVKPDELKLKFSASTDEQLAAAKAATTYNSVLPGVLKTQLELYEQDLERAYQKTNGENGRKLLDKQYNGAELLLKKLEPAVQTASS